jgi:hypothetical protein
MEVNSFDMRNRPIGYEDGKLPEGIHYIGNLVRKLTDERVLIHKWGNDHHNDCWIVKPDGSCGMEICTPVLKGWRGLKQVCYVADGLFQDRKISADERCSFHVHIDVSDLSELQIASIITWWVKCEAVFMDSVPIRRKRNQYCQLLGQTDIFENIESGLFSPESLLRKVGDCKYYSVNTFHYQNKKRKTIEFRIMDNDCCRDSWSAKNWVRLILHFVERAIKKGLPVDYEENDQWSGYCWLDPMEVFEFLGFLPEQYDLSAGLQQVRRWFLNRLFTFGRETGLSGVMGDLGRRISIKQVDELKSQILGENEVAVTIEDVYSDKFRV